VVMRNNDDDASSRMARFLGRALVFGPTKCFTEPPQQQLIALRTGLCDYDALEKCGIGGCCSEKVLIRRNVDPADVVVVKCVVGPGGAGGVDRPGLL
jgi:hypothetical protein